MKDQTRVLTAGALLLAFLLLAFLLPSGCGREMSTRMRSDSMLGEMQAEKAAAMDSADATAVAEGQAATQAVATDRKIIYTTEIELVVKDFADFETQIASVIRSHGGFAARREADRRSRSRRGGVWVIRIPVDQYDDFITGVTSLGFAQSRVDTANDVTEEFVDLEARIANKRKLEERIVAMLEDRVGKLSDVMEIERELSRVREEIERMEGRLRFLTDQTSLATITLRVREELTFTPKSAPTFADRIGSAWGQSLESLQRFAEAVVIAVVAIAPWSVILVPLGVIGVLFVRRVRKAIFPLLERSSQRRSSAEADAAQGSKHAEPLDS
jgi:hypothetical protein